MLLRRISLLAVLALGGLLGAACGDDDDGGGVGGGGGGGDFCDQARALEELEDPDLSDPEAFDDVIQQFEDAAADAPDEIQDDLQVLLGAFEALNEGDLESVDQAELEEASENVTTFLEDECGIDAT